MKKSASATGPFGRQAGASFFGMIIIFALFGLFILVALRIVPAYMDNRIIVSTIERMDAQNDLSSMTLGQIRSELAQTLRINGIRDFSADSVQLVRENGVEYVDLSYESRASLFYNIEAVMTFNERFER